MACIICMSTLYSQRALEDLRLFRVHFVLLASGLRCCRYASLGRGQGGVLFVRPCAAVASHMRELASTNPMLQYPLHDAEQDFFNWCDAPRLSIPCVLLHV